MSGIISIIYAFSGILCDRKRVFTRLVQVASSTALDGFLFNICFKVISDKIGGRLVD